MFFLGRLRTWWTNRQRLLFWFHDGDKWHRADPMRIARTLEAVLPEYLALVSTIQDDPKKIMAGPLRDDLMKQQSQAVVKLTEASRKVFGLQPLTDTGGTEDGICLRIIFEWLYWMEGASEEAALFPVSPDGASASHPV